LEAFEKEWRDNQTSQVYASRHNNASLRKSIEKEVKEQFEMHRQTVPPGGIITGPSVTDQPSEPIFLTPEWFLHDNRELKLQATVISPFNSRLGSGLRYLIIWISNFIMVGTKG